jgi:hypothetical protein
MKKKTDPLAREEETAPAREPHNPKKTFIGGIHADGVSFIKELKVSLCSPFFSLH